MVGTLPLESIAEVKEDLEGRVDMKSKKLMGVVSLITIASMALAGCGNSASSVDTIRVFKRVGLPRLSKTSST